MSNDDFTTAARTEAHARSMLYIFSAAEPDKPLDWGGGFQEGAQWARTYLAEREPTDAERAEAAMDELGCELRVVENGSTTCDTHGGYATSDDVCEVVHMVLAAALGPETA